MLSTRATWTLCALSLVLFVITIGHLHPSSGFTLPLLPSGRLFEPVYLHDRFLPEDRLLNTSQCLEAYPQLYYEADRARRWYSSRSGITADMVDAAEKDGGNARLTIINNNLYIKHYGGGINTRTQAMLATVYSIVLTSPEPMPDVDFVIQTSDGGGGDHPHFVLDRKEDQPHMWLMPDFGFFSWPEPGVGAYTEVRDKTLAFEEQMGLEIDDSGVVSSNWKNKMPKLLWRGSPMVEVRQDLLRGSENQPWSDVKALDWDAVNTDDEDRKAKAGDLKSPAEHCHYAFLAHVEGWAYSGRLKYLQQCRSVIVMHPLEWIQHYHHLFNSKHNDPDQNVVEVPLPLEKYLPGVMETLLDPRNQEMVERIADNSWNFLRQGYISPSANACYFRYVLKAYAEVQRFQPVLDRGVPYESFLLMGKTHWDPHR